MQQQQQSVDCVWVEQFRPKRFDDIILSQINKKILSNIIATRHFPNLLLYGMPGTGKTSTIINLIHAFQGDSTRNVIHLNASDERGIDVIRNQIFMFVDSINCGASPLKFIILDEVDYMTKNAQQALKNLLQSSQMRNVRVCLMCNYISKIDAGLQDEFVQLSFDQLPKSDVIRFLHHISATERLSLTQTDLEHIQAMFQSDVRSMINYMQTNQDIHGAAAAASSAPSRVINDAVWAALAADCSPQMFAQIGATYNIDTTNIINKFAHYIIYYCHPGARMLAFLESMVHAQIQNDAVLIAYFCAKFPADQLCD